MHALCVLSGSRQTRRARIFALTALVVLLVLFLDTPKLPARPGPGSTTDKEDKDFSPEHITNRDKQSVTQPTHTAADLDKTGHNGHDGDEPSAWEDVASDGQRRDRWHDELQSWRLSDFPPPTPTHSPAEPTSPADEPDLGTAKPSSANIDPPASTVELTKPTPEQNDCVPFEQWIKSRPGPNSAGKRQFPYVRPPPECRTFILAAMETLINDVKGVIKDPDLSRLFENAYPMTLDTMVKWRGYANETDPGTGESAVTDQELAYVITGDIDAMWLRDSASQIYSYLPLLEASSDPDSLASLWRGLINSHARYIIISPYCHSFQPPPESGIPPTTNGAYQQNHPIPPYDPQHVFDCKWELDSLASFLQISVGYFQKTGDYRFFQKYNWIAAVDAAVKAAGAMRLGTYADDGKVEQSAWTFTGWTNRGSETLTNDGLGNPSKENGMVRTAFRPSDDATIFQFLVPANMMFAAYLESASEIMSKLQGDLAANLTEEMREFAGGIRRGIDKDAIVNRPGFGDIFAYEVDGFGGTNVMDDANVPSLLAMPLWNFTKPAYGLPDLPKAQAVRGYLEIYRNTRRFVLSEHNSYFMRGPAISAVGGPHVGPGKAWPMAAVIAGLTAYDPISGLDDVEAEVEKQVRMVLDSTAGSGVLHESVNSWNEGDFTRAWFGWANGLFGELVLKMREYETGQGGEGLLGRSWQ
ncbi:Metal-independent alpha-mannosidase [Tolypocladium paradoxum]|uniref:Metal-independent alpha-mannosidase n=1 Tax=Tolypocladium paradoxum TaxID=94208 RepID=A0A2S4KW45_9HYPO|nr:Metal-independent alpha-mannosidase [Tolypocladium paradoxum]